MTIIHLHGKLGKTFHKEYVLDVGSPREAVKALCVMVPSFKEHFMEGHYTIYTGSKNDKFDIDETTLSFRSQRDIHIIPCVAGAKNKGTGKLIAGIALVGLALIPGVGTLAAGALSGITGAAVLDAAVVHGIASIGLSLALGGAAQLLAPKQKSNESLINNFDGTPNNTQEGGCVPIIYGLMLSDGYPVSFSVESGVNPFSYTNGTTGNWTNSDVGID